MLQAGPGPGTAKGDPPAPACSGSARAGPRLDKRSRPCIAARNGTEIENRPMNNLLTPIADTIEHNGFAFVRAPEMKRLLEGAGLRDWEAFAPSWDDLGVDTYMADGGRYRRRRFGVFRAAPGGIVRKAHQPHYQSRDYNALNGGIERWFEPMTDAIAHHPALTAILRASHALFDRMTPTELRPEAWHVEIHQFRIEAREGV